MEHEEIEALRNVLNGILGDSAERKDDTPIAMARRMERIRSKAEEAAGLAGCSPFDVEDYVAL